jgi:hypothetical protein
MNWKFAKGGDAVSAGDPSPTSDFDEIRKVAREAAAERDQRIAISDLINAFPVENERLAYGMRDVSEAMPTVITKIENALAPRVVDFMSHFEAEVREGAQRQLAAALTEFGETQLKDSVQAQIVSLEENSRLLQERQIAAFNDFSNQFERVMEARLSGVLERFSERLQLATNPRPQQPDLPSQSKQGASRGFWERFGLLASTCRGRRPTAPQASYSPRSTNCRLSAAMAAAGLSPFGQALVQLRMVWQR